MEAYIKYKRIAGDYTDNELQTLFDSFIQDGFDIISYKENQNRISVVESVEGQLENEINRKLRVVIVVGKRQSRVL